MPRSFRSFILPCILVGLILAACSSPATPTQPGPVTPPSPKSAAVNEIVNIVEARPSIADAFAPATIGLTVNAGGQVQTGVESKARLDFSDGSIVRLAPTSSFTLQGFATSEGLSVRHLQLLAGKIWASLLGGALEIETPVGVATVRGSFAVFQYAPGDPGDPSDDLLVVDCLEGSCAAGNATAGIVRLGNLEGLALSSKGSLKLTLTAAEVEDFIRNNPESVGLAATLTAAPPATNTPPPPTTAPTDTATVAPPTEPPTPTAAAIATTPAQVAAVTPPSPTPSPTLSVAILGQHVVRGGETLNCIGRGYGVLPSAIAQVNGLTTASSLTVGQTLAIPDVQWVNISSGPVCAPQFTPKYPGLTVTTPPPAPTTPVPVATTPSPTPATGGTPGINHMGTEKVVIADYVMWYSPQDLDGSISWDAPASGPYQSDDLSTIQRHVAEAQRACLNGFSAHWYGPGDQRTTSNFNQLLKASAGTGLRHAILILTNILPGVTEQDIVNAVNYVKDNWAQGPNYLRLGGRPVLIFTDMSRPWGDDASALAGWTRIRAAADPNHSMIWMAEGLTTTYNPLFDGLYVYRIDHADFPESWLKQPRWATNLRTVEQQGNLPLGGLYFADTIAPGFDDTRAAAAGSDLRAPAPPFSRDRRDGGYYADTYSVIPQTGGDFLFVKSYNEWIEGTEIEPGRTYGDLYLNLTCRYANDYRSR